LIGVLAANHWSIVVTPLALVKAQAVSSITGAPSHSNFLPSNSIP
jgi:hypothetical protein